MVHDEPIVIWLPTIEQDVKERGRIQDPTCAAVNGYTCLDFWHSAHNIRGEVQYRPEECRLKHRIKSSRSLGLLHVSRSRSDHSDSRASALMVSLSLGGSDIGGNCEEKVTIRKPRRPWLKPLLIIVSVVIILHFLTLLILVRVIDLPKATTSLPHLESAPSLGKGPSVGFDLTPSYGTAVARHHNGSVTNVGRVAVDPDYEDMMHRLSTGGRVL